MTERKLIVIWCLLWAAFGFWFMNYVRLRHVKVDVQSVSACVEEAEKQRITYKDTEFANSPFYKWCIDNIRCTSPLHCHEK